MPTATPNTKLLLKKTMKNRPRATIWLAPHTMR